MFQSASSTGGTQSPAEQHIATAMKQEKHEPQAALGNLLAAAEDLERQIERNPTDTAARQNYNFAVARVFTVIKNAKLNPWAQPLEVPAPAGGKFLLAHQRDNRPHWKPALYDFTPADQFDVAGSYVTQKVRKDGLGAPLVAIGRDKAGNANEDYTTERIFYGVTAIIRFEGRQAVIKLEDPLAVESVRLGGHTFPLAADYTTPLAVMLATMNPKAMEMSRLLRPEDYATSARIARLQPYDPAKTVVLVIHGLADSPATWAPMINRLRSDERIRENYQFWFYSYPSGYPYPYSASILRGELDGVEERFPLRKKIVVIGHSMGGCISRLLITDSKEKLWMELFKKPPQETNLSPDSRKLLTQSLIFRHRPEIGRVIFISAPLRGSDLAGNWIGRIGSSLVHAPSTLIKVGAEAVKVATFRNDDMKLRRVPNSVDTLAPNNHFVRTINTIPVTPGIPHNVICGDRGKGGNKDKTRPQMSDGVVPYWSSHMETAQSELIVHCNHSAHQNAQAIEEVHRILTEDTTH